MKKISIFISFMFLGLFLVVSSVGATDLSGSMDPGNYGSGSGGGSSCSDNSGNYNGTDGLRVTVIKSNGKYINSADFYNSNNLYGNIPSSSIGNNCSKIEYLKGTCSKRKNSLSSKSFTIFMDGSGNVTGIQNWLEGSNYSNLISLVKSTGYNCIDNVGSSGCSVDVMNDTYIVVEPMVMFAKKFATAYEMESYGVSCYLSNKWGILASFRASAGTYFGVSLSDKVTGSGGQAYYDAIKNDHSTNGIAIYSLSDIIYLPKEGTLVIEKIKTGTTTLITSDDVTFTLYSGSTCSASNKIKDVTFTGSETLSLAPGSYSIKEKTAPDNYKKNETCHDIQITSGKTTKKSVSNDPTCISEFNDYKNANGTVTKAQRLQLFEKYGNKFYQLFDFSNTEAVDACQTTRDCGNNNSYACRGISVSYSGFNQNNLSCFMTRDDAGNFCSVNFILNTTILTSFENSILKSGQILRLYESGTLEDQLPRLTLVETCYNINGNSVLDKTLNISDYITNLKVLGKTSLTNGSLTENLVMNESLSIKTMEEPIKTNPIGSSSLRIEQSVILTRKACISKISGEVVDNTNCEGNYEGEYILKEALVPKFTNNGTLYVYPHLELTDYFKDDSNNKINLSISEVNSCVYNFEQEIIIDDNINVMFRIIDTTNPFPGTYGTGRVIGSNWCDDKNTCTIEDPNYIEQYITSRPNSSSNNPIYKIVLNRDTINEIRRYNKEHSYDENNVEYVNGEYKNLFLSEFEQYFLIFDGSV